MIKMNSLRAAAGARRKKRRIGRGTGSGAGCTSGHGNKGEKCRSGAKVKAYFEGGQTPLTRRLPKRGGTKRTTKGFQTVNVGALAKLGVHDKEIDAKVLHEMGLVHSAEEPVKVLGMGEIDKPITIKADAYSRAAREKLRVAKATVR
jgi:large subunit ribosomal protein L15